jgi:hypothetical protein
VNQPETRLAGTVNKGRKYPALKLSKGDSMEATKIDILEINGKKILMEMEAVTVDLTAMQTNTARSETLPEKPEGSEYTGIKESCQDAASYIADTLEGILTSVDQGLEKVQPAEWSVELSMGFAVEKDIKIPYIMSAGGKANGGIKITAKWKRDE